MDNKGVKINLGNLEKNSKNVIKETIELFKNGIQNTEQDIKAIIDSGSQCLEDMEDIHNIITNRTIEYHTEITRILLDTKILPIEIISYIFDEVCGDIKAKNFKPIIYKLKNPKEYVWERLEPKCDVVSIDNIVPGNRSPLIFIHGMGYEQSEYSASSFFKLFEQNAELFRGNSKHWDFYDVYLVSYDSYLYNETKSIIRKGFETILGQPVFGTATTLFWAVLWRELERRAKITGDYLSLFFNKLSKNHQSNSTIEKSMVVAHSLGCFVAAHGEHCFVQQNLDKNEILNYKGLIERNVFFAPAVPSNSFATTGDYSYAPLICPYTDGAKGTSIFYSYTDYILLSMYTLLANGHTAMGTTGAVMSRYGVNNINVTDCVREQHYGENYFNLLREYIKWVIK